MLKKSSTSTISLVFRNSLFASFLFLFAGAAICRDLPGDVPIERDFVRLNDGRWIWLKKVDWHATEIILGKGKKTAKNRIWSEIHESSGNSSQTWDYAFFIKIKRSELMTRNAENNLQVAVSTYDIGTNVFRPVMIYTLRDNRLECEGELPNFNVATDHNLISIYGNNFGNKIVRQEQIQPDTETRPSEATGL